tara:strand:+ start:44728 stop:46128 length:1401 start_codon:yes stop_codon:yes gene_type:complete
MVLTLNSLNSIWGSPFNKNRVALSSPLGSICTDSRKILEGSFYVPLIGRQYNGHCFIKQARELGAQAAVVSRHWTGHIPEDFLHWKVEDTLEAFQQIALLYRVDLDIPVVAVTGSVGKTTTKELISEVLKPLGNIASSFGNNNNDIGVPMTLLKSKVADAAIVVEMGMRGLGEIHRLSLCAQPDIAVITNIGTAHIGCLGSRLNIAKAKCEITAFLKPKGVVIIPAKEQLLEETLRKSWNGRVIRVAIKEVLPTSSIPNNSRRLNDSDFIGSFDHETDLLEIEGQTLKLPLEGEHNVMNFMLALAVAKELKISFREIQDINIKSSPGRNYSFQLGGITILDETYNASPESVNASMELLMSKPGRHFAVLGKMLELGEQSIRLHQYVAERAVTLGLDGLIIFVKGPEGVAMKKVAKKIPFLKVVSTFEEAFEVLHSTLRPGDNLLLKASRGALLERLLPYIHKAYSD